MWLYKGNEFTSEDIGDNAGFVYLIENLETGQLYLGKKVFWSKRTLPPLKGKKRKRKVIKESDWKSYWSSSKSLKESVQQLGEGKFRRTILSLHKTRSMLNYAELCEQILRDVLHARLPNGERMYINDNIDRVYYNSNTLPLEEFVE